MRNDNKKVLTAFTALLNGRTLKIKDRRYRLFQAGDHVTFPSMEGIVEYGQYQLAIECVSPEGVSLGIDWTFCSVLELLHSMPQEDYEALLRQDQIPVLPIRVTP